jgi:hypothetical protein
MIPPEEQGGKKLFFEVYSGAGWADSIEKLLSEADQPVV